MGRKIPEFEDFFNDLDKIATKLNRTSIEYGYPEEVMHKEAGVPVAQVAAWQEEGVMDSGGGWKIIPRRFMTEAELLNEETTRKSLYSLTESILTGRQLQVNKVLKEIGKRSADDVREAILYGTYAPLKPSTIAKKGHSTPLIETEQLYNDATFKITTGDQ